MADYAKEVLVETDWLAEHLDDPSIRIVEVDENPALYAEAHIPGAIGFDWKKDLQDQVKRDFLGPEDFGALLADQPLMQNVLADLALETEAAMLTASRLARLFKASALNVVEPTVIKTAQAAVFDSPKTEIRAAM